jgi:hypothetical protein
MSLNHSPSIVTDGLVLCLDAANKRSYLGTGTAWTDLKGVNNGSLTNMDAANFSDGNGGSLSFDGANERVDFGNVLNISGEISISSWVKVDAFPINSGRGLIVSKGYSGNEEAYHFGFAAGNLLRFYTYASSINGVVYTHSLSTSTWYNIVGTFNGSTWILYIDSDFVDSNNDSTALRITSEPLIVGASSLSGSVSRFFDGSIASASIYNRALTADEIRQNYEATLGRYT